jgi:hypothetical protein
MRCGRRAAQPLGSLPVITCPIGSRAFGHRAWGVRPPLPHRTPPAVAGLRYGMGNLGDCQFIWPHTVVPVNWRHQLAEADCLAGTAGQGWPTGGHTEPAEPAGAAGLR